MKKHIQIIPIALFSFFLPFLALAQEASEGPEIDDVTFFQVVMNQGIIGFSIWIIIFCLTMGGFILGLIAIVSSAKTKSTQIPLSVKLLPAIMTILFILGFMGVVTSFVDSFSSIATATGATKQQSLALAISQAFYIPSFALLGALEHAIFFTISLIVLHFRHKKIITKNSEQKRC